MRAFTFKAHVSLVFRPMILKVVNLRSLCRKDLKPSLLKDEYDILDITEAWFIRDLRVAYVSMPVPITRTIAVGTKTKSQVNLLVTSSKGGWGSSVWGASWRSV